METGERGWEKLKGLTVIWEFTGKMVSYSFFSIPRVKINST